MKVTQLCLLFVIGVTLILYTPLIALAVGNVFGEMIQILTFAFTGFVGLFIVLYTNHIAGEKLKENVGSEKK